MNSCSSFLITGQKRKSSRGACHRWKNVIDSRENVYEEALERKLSGAAKFGPETNVKIKSEKVLNKYCSLSSKETKPGS